MSFTLAIIILTCIVSISVFNNDKARGNLLLYPYAMKGGRQLFRLISHGFIHGDFVHLAFNMLTLFYFGPVVENIILNKTQYILFYVSAIIAASLYDYFKQQNNSSYAALGASGAISAVLFSTIILDPWSRNICLFGVLCLPNIVYGVLYLVYSAYMSRRGGDNIGHNAHFWGAVYGFAVTALLRPDLFQSFIQMLLKPRLF